MAEVHPYVLELLDALLRSRLAGLAELATARVNAAEAELNRTGEERDPLAPRAEETSTDRGRRQLKIADAVVGGVLRRELLLFDRNLDLVRRLRSGLAERDEGGAFETVYVERTEGIQENLLTSARRERLQALLDAWQRGFNQTLERLVPDGDF